MINTILTCLIPILICMIAQRLLFIAIHASLYSMEPDFDDWYEYIMELKWGHEIWDRRWSKYTPEEW